MRLFLVLIAIVASPAGSSPHAKFQRTVEPSGPHQNYLVADEAIWKNARPDLDDLRLYSGDTEIPYSLVVQRNKIEENRTELRVLQPAKLGGKTQFLIDMSGLTEYNHVELKLGTKDFVAHALVDGQDDPHGQKWALLGDCILYDLSSERLGSNSVLRIPRSTYRYLRVTIDGPVRPSEVRGAASETAQEHPEVWRDVGGTPSKVQQGKDTIFVFSVADKIPIERVTFTVGGSGSNFRRDVEVRNEKDGWLGSGQIERVHLERNGRRIDSENYSITFSENGERAIKVVVHNGDDLPLDITSARLQQLERRIYFEAAERGRIALYYGDDKLAAPVYDYAKFFQQEKDAAVARLGPEVSNTAYLARPDERPWSERHPVVLWIAIIAAVLALGAVALRSLGTTAA